MNIGLRVPALICRDREILELRCWYGTYTFYTCATTIIERVNASLCELIDSDDDARNANVSYGMVIEVKYFLSCE